MASNIKQVLGSDKIIKINDFNLLGSVQGYDWAPNFNAQDIFELGRDTKTDTAMELETGGSFEVESTGHTPGILARMVVQRNASGAFTGYLYNSGGAGSTNTYTLTQSDLKEMSFDLVVHEKPDQVTFSRTLVLPRAYLTSISGSIDSGGNATETYNWAGQEVVGLVNPYHDARCIPAKRASATQLQLIKNDGTNESTVTSATHTLVYAWCDERRFGTASLGEATSFALDAANGTVTLSTTEGYSIDSAAIGRALVYKTSSPSTTFPAIGGSASERGTSAFYIKAHMAKIFLAPSNANSPADSELWLRAQSCSYSIDMRVEALRQILKNSTGSAVFCRVPNYPFDISVSVSVLESDWNDWKTLFNSTKTGKSGIYAQTYEWAPGDLKSQFAVVIQYFTKNGTLLQTWRFTDLRIDSYGERTNIGGRGEISFGLRGTAFTLVGATA